MKEKNPPIYPKTFEDEIHLRQKGRVRSIKWVTKNQHLIDSNITFEQAVDAYELGFDVTQLKPTSL